MDVKDVDCQGLTLDSNNLGASGSQIQVSLHLFLSLLAFQNLDSLEGSIQNLLSELYPPFEATAPTLLSQLFQIIDRRYQGDALRCLLDFLVPAKHILDTVQQAACVSLCMMLKESFPNVFPRSAKIYSGTRPKSAALLYYMP